MKKALILLTLALCLILASCGGSNNSGTTTTAVKNDTTAAVKTDASTTAAVPGFGGESEPESSVSDTDIEASESESETEPEASDSEPEASDSEPETSASASEKKSLFDYAPDELKEIEDFKTLLSDRYCLKSVSNEMGQEMSTIFYRDGDVYASVVDSAVMSFKMIRKDGKAYYIFDSAKKYFEADVSDMPMISFEMEGDDEVNYAGVTEKEYDGKTVKVYTFKGKTDEETISFYVDGEDIVALEEGGNVAPFEVSSDIPGGFDIPDDYTEASSDEAMALMLGGLSSITGIE